MAIAEFFEWGGRQRSAMLCGNADILNTTVGRLVEHCSSARAADRAFPLEGY